MSVIPDSHKDLLDDEAKTFAVLATVMQDGTPQNTPVWFDVEGDLIRINTAQGRVKDQNLMKRPNVALVLIDPQDPYRYMQIRGGVERRTEEGARDHIDRLSNKYRGTEEYEWYGGETRVIYYIRPRAANTMG
jgi:PPOX class probable F420-dependent enzyme